MPSIQRNKIRLPIAFFGWRIFRLHILGCEVIFWAVEFRDSIPKNSAAKMNLAAESNNGSAIRFT